MCEACDRGRDSVDECLHSDKGVHKRHAEREASQASRRITRRELLKATGALGLAFGLGPIAAACANDGGAARTSMQNSTAVSNGKAKRITILQTADIHGQLNTHDEFFWENGKPVFRKTGGFARIKSLVEGVRKENPQGTFVVDAGDCFQGSGWVALSKGEIMEPIMQQMRYDLVLPGNWEVVYGKDQCLKVINRYGSPDHQTPVVCSNMFHDMNGQPGEAMFRPYYTQVVNGVKMGFIGFNDPKVPVRQDPSYSVGIKFTEPDVNAAKYIQLLREQEKCDVVFAVTHMGIAQQVGLSNQQYMQGTDYILGADTHERIRKPLDGKYAKVTEPGAFGSFVGRLDLVVENGKVKEQSYELMEVGADRYPEDEGMKRTLTRVQEPYKQELGRVLGQTTTPLLRYYVLETPIDNLLTDALYDKLKPDIALSNGFRFCPPLVPDSSGKADITKEYLWSALPVDAKVRTGEVKGEIFKKWMEKELNNVFATDFKERFGGWVIRMKGMEVNFTAGKPMGQRVNSIKIGGEPLDPQKIYTVAACERGGDPKDVLCRIKGVQNRKDMTFSMHDVVEEYLKKNSPVSPKIEGRVTATDLPQDVLTQMPGVDYQFS